MRPGAGELGSYIVLACHTRAGLFLRIPREKVGAYIGATRCVQPRASMESPWDQRCGRAVGLPGHADDGESSRCFYFS